MRRRNLKGLGDQGDLFRAQLSQILNRNHSLHVLGNHIDWSIFDQEFAPLYLENVGRPGHPIRLLVGLHYLKYAYNESDESVVERLLENPYWQYFCGFEYFKYEVALDSSSLVRVAKRETKKLRVYLSRVLQDIERKSSKPGEVLQHLFLLGKRVLEQKRVDHHKVYSIHAPEVECISKGKVHKRYEFGCKVALVSTSKENWVVGVKAIHGNPYDGHRLERSIEQAERVTGWRPSEAYCDRGYRGVKAEIGETKIHLTGKKKGSLTRSAWRWLRRRAAIEPIIGHLKVDTRLDRNYLLGEEGDRVNAILSGCGFNARELQRAFFLFLFFWVDLDLTNPTKIQLTLPPNIKIGYEAVKLDERLDGKFVLRTTTDLSKAQIDVGDSTDLSSER